MTLNRNHMVEIGRKGGQAKSWAKTESARNAARVRWTKWRENKRLQAAVRNASHTRSAPRFAQIIMSEINELKPPERPEWAKEIDAKLPRIRRVCATQTEETIKLLTDKLLELERKIDP